MAPSDCCFPAQDTVELACSTDRHHVNASPAVHGAIHGYTLICRKSDQAARYCDFDSEKAACRRSWYLMVEEGQGRRV